MSLSSVFRLLPRSVQYNILSWLKPSYRSINEGKNKLRKTTRYKPGCVKLSGFNVNFVDSASCLSAYEQIFEKEIYDFISQDKKPQIIDCGANIGLAVLYWKKKFPDAEILAFEPDPEVFEMLSKNMKNNGFTDVDLIPKGVWKEENMLSFYQEGADAGRIIEKEVKEDNIINVPVVRLKDYLGDTVDMLKVDIEGAEVEVLNDCKGMLGSVRNLFVEYHSFIDKEQQLDELLNVIRLAGFRFYIQQELVASRPFVQRLHYGDMDHQLNIFAYRL